MSKVTIDLEISCGQCNRTLDVETAREGGLVVEPCKNCMEEYGREEYHRGFESGQEHP